MTSQQGQDNEACSGLPSVEGSITNYAALLGAGFALVLQRHKWTKVLSSRMTV